MASLDEELALELARLESSGLLRTLSAPAGGVDFSSNDVLGLARHPAVREAAAAASAEHGAGARASRLLGGGSPLHDAAERAAADWLGAQAALLFPSGYQANLGLVGALARRGDVIVSDELVHASLVDAARLSRARVVVHRHLDLEELARALARASGARRRLVLTEGVFSVGGDVPPLVELAALCERHGAWLLVDEAHAAGVVGPGGRGAWAAAGSASPALAARVVTGGKALGVGGAFVVGSATLRAHLVNHARAFLFTTAPPPATAGALARAIELARGMDAERARLQALARGLARALALPEPAAAIVPVPVGAAGAAVELAERLRRKGLEVRAVRPPTVPEGAAALRLVVHAFNTDAECEELGRTLAAARAEPREAERRAAPAASPAPPVAPEDKRAAEQTFRRALFVVGTDTGIGKTVVAALLLRAAKARGAAAYWKPVQTGTESDTQTVGALAEAAPHELLRPAWTFEHPASPHEAAARAGHAIEPRRLEQGLAGLLRTLPELQLVIELAGGLLVPYALDPSLATQADWLERAGAPLVLVARAGVGTLNHTLLTLEALRARHLEPRALFLVGEPHASNHDTLRRVADVPHLFELPPFPELGPRALEAWLAAHDLGALFEP